MVRAQQARDHHPELRRHEREHNGVPPLQHRFLKVDVRAFAAGQDAACVARLAAGCLDERVEVPTALELVLDPEASVDADDLAPLRVDLALEVEGAFLVGDVARGDEQRKDHPEEEAVDGEEGAVVEEDAGPADEAGEQREAGGGGGDDQLRAVPDADDVCVGPDVEPDEEAGDEPSERIKCKLCVRKCWRTDG